MSSDFDWHFAMQELNATAIGALRGHSAAEDAAALKEKEEMASRLHELESKLLKQQQDQQAGEQRREEEWRAKVERSAATEEELQQRKLQEAAMQAKQKDLEAQLQQQIEETERLAKSQERKRQQRTLLDEQLLRTLPLVHEVRVAGCFRYCVCLTFNHLY